MRTRFLFVSALAFLSGCPASTTDVPDSGVPVDADASLDSGATIDSGAATDSGTDGGPAVLDAPATSDTGPVTLHFEVENVMVFADCKPIVAADPIRVNWDTVVTSGAAGEVTATATLRLFGSDGSLATQPFSVAPDPLTFGVGETTVPTTKDVGSPIDGCGFCGATATLEVRYAVTGGETFMQTVSGLTVGCAF